MIIISGELLIIPFFQGLRLFKYIAIINIISPIVRLCLGLGLVIVGWQIYGALGGFIISQILLSLLGYLIISRHIAQKSTAGETEQIGFLKSDLLSKQTQIFQYFLMSIILAILMNSDILFAKHFFTDEVAGTYAGISIIAKFLVFVGMSIETVYYPYLSGRNIYKKGKIFLLSLLYLVVTLGALGFFYLFGVEVLSLFKPGFEQHLSLLYMLIIYCGSLALLNFLMKICVAFKRYIINYIVGIIFLISIPLLYVYVGSSMYELIGVFLVMMCSCLISGFGYLGMQK